jgi:hypothetical protein
LGIGIRALPDAGEGLASPRPRFLEAQVWLPVVPLAGLSGRFSDYLLAAAAHASAHVRFGGQRLVVKSLKPAQVAIISLLEDARVEHLAAERFPGLRRLWAPFHVARAEGAKTSLSLLARLARALLDPHYSDDDSWVNKGRELFFEARPEWDDPSTLRRLGGALGNDLGQMRVQFNAKDYVVQPPYRDDNVGLWQFEQAEDGAALESEGARSSERESERPGRERQRSAAAAQAAATPDTEPAIGLRLQRQPAPETPTRYPEWDYVIARERSEFCSLYERSAALGDARRVEAALERYGPARKRLARSALRLARRQPTRERRLLDGDRLDLPAAIAATVARACGVRAEPRVYQRVRLRVAPPALLILLDLSESLNAVPPGASTALLDLARTASALLAASLGGVVVAWAVHGFSSNGRHDVGYYRFKDFDEPYDELVRARLAGMRAGLSTRRHSALPTRRPPKTAAGGDRRRTLGHRQPRPPIPDVRRQTRGVREPRSWHHLLLRRPRLERRRARQAHLRPWKLPASGPPGNAPSTPDPTLFGALRKPLGWKFSVATQCAARQNPATSAR